MTTDLTQYAGLLGDIKARIRQAQIKATISANSEMILMYWDIGRMIHKRQQIEGWGAAVIPRLAADLKNELPKVKGFSERNIGYMIRFAHEYGASPIFQQPVAKLTGSAAESDEAPRAVEQMPLNELSANLHQLVAKIPWGHNILLMEKVKDLPARLTATPTRKDGHHPIIFMQCGPVRYRDDAKKQAEKRPFDHFVIPRFTALRVPLDKDEKDVSIQENYSLMVVNEMRNQLIVDDVVKSHESGRNCLVLSDRTAHVELIAGKLREKIPEVITLRGGRGTKEIAEIFKRISDTPADKQLTLVATGRYIGEGFDEPRLDTLFLTMPISWKGTLQQYAGRLHRLFEDKKEVQIYDYVDTHVRMLEKMYHKRLNGYASIGYKAKGGGVEADSIDIIFDKSNFLPVYSNDILSAEREILIVSPFITKRRTVQMLQNLEIALRNKVRVIVMTRPVVDFGEKEPVALQETLAILQDAGVSLVFRPNIHQKFALIDQRIVWYGSINLLSFGNAEESIMRLDSPNIAGELVKSIEN